MTVTLVDAGTLGRAAGRLVEQQHEQRPRDESQQERADEHQQQYRLSLRLITFKIYLVGMSRFYGSVARAKKVSASDPFLRSHERRRI